jgi:outer membrane lipoprotein LolB
LPVAKQQGANITSWEIRGAIAAKNRTKGWSATMNWTQSGPNNYQIRLIGPLGNGAVIITKQDGFVTFKDGPKTSTSRNGEELLFKQTGTRLPVDNLYYWVRGMPAPGEVQSQKRDGSNYLSQINQNGYTVNFTGYTLVNGKVLPSAIRLEGRGLMVKLMIRHWNIH